MRSGDVRGNTVALQAVSFITPENYEPAAEVFRIRSVQAHALAESDLEVFLQRRRRGSGVVRPPRLGDQLVHTLELLGRLVPSQAGSLLLDDPTVPRRRSPLVFAAVFGPAQVVGTRVPSGEGIVGRVYQSGETYTTQHAGDDPNFYAEVDELGSFRTRSIVAAPVRLERTVCGVLELVNRKGRPSYSARDVDLVELVASYMSRSILNAVDIVKRNELVFRDDLTGLRNSRGLELFVERAVKQEKRRNGDLALMYIDVDHLKRLNDRHGHRAGSEALRRVARAISSAVGDWGTAFRLGGDEFVVVCPDTDADQADQIAQSLRETARERTPGALRWGGKLPAVSVSIGIGTLCGCLKDRGDAAGPTLGARLLTAADHALYRAKRGGRSRITIATRRDDTLGRSTRNKTTK